MNRLLLSLGTVFLGVAIGYVIQRVARARAGTSVVDLSRTRRLLQVLSLLVLNPIATIGAIWALELDEVRIALMPVMGVLALGVGGVSGIVIGKRLRLDRAQAGAYFCGSTMSNIGAIGALIVFLFLGERGFALVPMYRLFEEFTYYAFAFPIARSFSPIVSDASGNTKRFAAIISDPFIIVAVSSIVLGFTLNLLGVPRPPIFARANSLIIPSASILLLVSIGMALRFGRVRAYLKEAVLVALTKFGIVPAIVVSVAAVVGLGQIDDGLPLQVVVILSSAPVGFIALIPPSLYKLDLDLANSAWIVSTALLAIVIPLQMIVVQAIG